jgi:hypothetical protein
MESISSDICARAAGGLRMIQPGWGEKSHTET